jgi:hypothetical protein
MARHALHRMALSPALPSLPLPYLVLLPTMSSRGAFKDWMCVRMLRTKCAAGEVGLQIELVDGVLGLEDDLTGLHRNLLQLAQQWPNDHLNRLVGPRIFCLRQFWIFVGTQVL